MKIIYFEDLLEGSVHWGGEAVVDVAEMLEYARRNDPWPFHIDEEAARKTPFGGLIASGGYTVTMNYRLGQRLYNSDQQKFAFLGGFDWHITFPVPVRPGDRLRYRTVIGTKRPSSKPGRGVVNSVESLLNQNGEEAFRNEVAWLIATKPKGHPDESAG